MCSVHCRGLKSQLKYSLAEPDPPLRESGSARLVEVTHKKMTALGFGCVFKCVPACLVEVTLST